MTLQTSGAISFNDLHIEAGGTSGTQVSLNDADIIQLSRPHNPYPADSERRMSQFYGQQELLSNPFVLLHQVSGEEDAWREFRSTYADGTSSSTSSSSDAPTNEVFFSSANSELIGRTGRLLFIYTNGIDGSSGLGDIQIDKVTVEGVYGTGSATTYSWEAGNESWTTASAILPSYDPFPQNRSWYNLGTSTKSSQRGRFIRDAGGTPTANTGRTDAADGSYYAFAYSSAQGYGNYMFLRSPEITFGSGLPSTHPDYDGTGTGQCSIKYSVARLGNNIGLLRLFFVESGHASTTTRGAANEITITASSYSVESKNGRITLKFSANTVQNFDNFFNKVFDPIDPDFLDTVNRIEVLLDADDITQPNNRIRVFDGASSTDYVDFQVARMRPFEYIQVKQNGTVINEFRLGDFYHSMVNPLQLLNQNVTDQERYDNTITTASSYTLTVGY